MKIHRRFSPGSSGARSMRSMRAARRGTTLVETALCLVFVLLPVTLGGLQFGLVLTTTHSLQQVSRESGRFAAIHYNDSTFSGADTVAATATSSPSLKNYVKTVAASNGIPWNDIKNRIVVTPASGRNAGNPITVSITYPMQKRALLGKLGFMKPRVAGDADDGKIDHGLKKDSVSLGFLQRDYTVSSTFLME